MERLWQLQKQSKFHPRSDEPALRMAEEMGTLHKLLCVFPLPLRLYPSLAERAWQRAKLWIMETKGPEGSPAEKMSRALVKDQIRELLGPTGIPPEANLLANFLLVPSSAPQNLMNELLEDM